MQVKRCSGFDDETVPSIFHKRDDSLGLVPEWIGGIFRVGELVRVLLVAFLHVEHEPHAVLVGSTSPPEVDAPDCGGIAID